MAKEPSALNHSEDLFGQVDDYVEFDSSYRMADSLLEQALQEYRVKKEKALNGKQEEIFSEISEPLFQESNEDITTEALFSTSEFPVREQQPDQEPGYTRYESEGTPVAKKAVISEVETGTEGASLKRKRMWASLLVAAIIVVLGAILAMVLYRSLVLEENVITNSTNENYSALVEYADEFSMLSDSEKRELLDLQDEYDSLNISQKEQINTYFLEQTGQTYNELLNTYILYEQNKANETQE